MARVERALAAAVLMAWAVAGVAHADGGGGGGGSMGSMPSASTPSYDVAAEYALSLIHI